MNRSPRFQIYTLASILFCIVLTAAPLSASARSNSVSGQSAGAALPSQNKGFQQIKQAAFTPNGGWIILYGVNSYFASKDVPTDLTDKLDELATDSKSLNFISFTADGGWIIVYGDKFYFGKGLPKTASDRLSKINDSGLDIQDIGFAPDGEWVILYGANNYAASKGISKDITGKLDQLKNQLRTLKQVIFTSDCSWLILYNDNPYLASGITSDMKDWLKQLNTKGWPIVRISFYKPSAS